MLAIKIDALGGELAFVVDEPDAQQLQALAEFVDVAERGGAIAAHELKLLLPDAAQAEDGVEHEKAADGARQAGVALGYDFVDELKTADVDHSVGDFGGYDFAAEWVLRHQLGITLLQHFGEVGAQPLTQPTDGGRLRAR